jgi:hypothetical protein
MRDDQPDRNLLHDLAELFKLLGAAAAIEKPIHVGVLYKPEKGFSWPHFFDARGVIAIRSFAENVNHSKRLAVLFKFCARAIQGQVALFPCGRKARESIRITNQLGNRIWPETDTRVARNDPVMAFYQLQGNYILAKNRGTTEGKGGSRGGFTESGLPAKNNGAIMKLYGAGVQASEPKMPEKEAHDRAQEIHGKIFRSKRGTSGAPHALRGSVNNEPRPVRVGEMVVVSTIVFRENESGIRSVFVLGAVRNSAAR